MERSVTVNHVALGPAGFDSQTSHSMKKIRIKQSATRSIDPEMVREALGAERMTEEEAVRLKRKLAGQIRADSSAGEQRAFNPRGVGSTPTRPTKTGV